MGIVLNAPISDMNLLAVSKAVDIPVIITIAKPDADIEARIEAGASILNIACGTQTAEVVRRIRYEHPSIPLMATGGPSGAHIQETISAGANAIIYTPPTTRELFRETMQHYRD